MRGESPEEVIEGMIEADDPDEDSNIQSSPRKYGKYAGVSKDRARNGGE